MSRPTFDDMPTKEGTQALLPGVDLSGWHRHELDPWEWSSGGRVYVLEDMVATAGDAYLTHSEVGVAVQLAELYEFWADGWRLIRNPEGGQLDLIAPDGDVYVLDAQKWWVSPWGHRLWRDARTAMRNHK